MTAVADRHLLFGLLALQNGLIDQAQLVAAFQAWTLDKIRSLADILVARGDLNAVQRNLLEGLADQHVQKHGDIEKSLAAVPANRATRASLAELGEPEIEATLARVAQSKNCQTTDAEDHDPERTGTYSVGSDTSDGQRFRILRPHARGGLGAVFVAVDGELNREVALKQILEKHSDDPVSRQRFVAEAEITGGLEHPGVVPIYGLGTDTEGRPYYAMRLIKGDSLKEAIARFHDDDAKKAEPGRPSLDLRKLLRRFMDVCNAVDYAHSRGVIHRDLKPANIIVGKHGETLVVDWGLAKAVGRADPSAGEQTLSPSSGGSSETLPGSTLGTPAYMSPEQACGDLDRLGTRSDVYSLGATLYCLLTGMPPFVGDDIGKVLRDVQRGEFPPPRQLDPSIDKALEAVCKKAMATKPEERYGSCHALAADIERWTADMPVTCWNEPFTRRTRRWMNRNRTAVTAAVAAVIVALAGLGAVVAVQAQANGALTALNARLYESNAQVSRANAELSAANEKITQANAELMAEREKVQARFDLARDAIRLFHGEVSEDLLLKEKQFDDLRHKLLHGAAEFYGKLEALLQGQRDRASRAALGQAYEELGDLTARIGNRPEALGVHRKALAVRRSLAAGREDDARAALDVAKSLTAVGLLSRQTGDTPGALAAFEEARGLADGLVARRVGSDAAREVLGSSHYQIARLLSTIGKPAEALKALDQALTIRRVLAEANPTVTRFQSDLANSHSLLGFVVSRSGKQSESLEAYGRSLAILRTLVDANPAAIEFQSDLARCYNNVGAVLSRINKKTEALKPLGEALVIRQRLADANPAVTEFQSDLAFSHDNVSGVLSNLGKLSEALAESGRALGIRRKLADTNPVVTEFQSNLARSHTGMALLLYQANERSDALKSFKEAQVILQGLVDANPSVTDVQNDLARCLSNIGDLLAKEGRIPETLTTLEKALSIGARLAADHPEFPAYQTQAAITAIDLGTLKADHGDSAGGLRLCRGALNRLAAIEAPQNEELYMLARAHAMIGELLARAPSEPSRDPTDAPAAHFDAAMAVLHRAVAAGWRDPVNMPTDRSLDPLRSRDDFRLLMMDLAFPADPLARGR